METEQNKDFLHINRNNEPRICSVLHLLEKYTDLLLIVTELSFCF